MVVHHCMRIKTSLFKSLFRIKYLLHISHFNGRSPMCIRTCVVRSLFSLKRLSQASHWNGRSHYVSVHELSNKSSA